MKKILAVMLLVLVSMAPASTVSAALEVVLRKIPGCICCDEYAKYLRTVGYIVKVVESADLAKDRQSYGVPTELEGCHFSVIDGYLVEGHVPVAAIARLLAERPDITGISLPGMPPGSPGMPGAKEAPFEIIAFGKNGTETFSIE
jgi:hypothetical protein